VSTPTPYDLLGRYPDRTRPLVTHYDGPDSRIELSVTSVANAVAKAASMLRDGLGLPPGGVVSIDLPRHWQLPVWVLAALSVGATVGRHLPAPVDVRIIGPRGVAALAAGADPGADEVLASACDAFGLPVPGGAPAGAIDIGIEVRAHPDQFSPEPDAGAAAALLVDGVAVPWQAQPAPASPPGARLWVDEDTPSRGLLHAVALQPLLVRGSVVIGTGLDPEQAARVRATEAVTGRAGG
jgi:uncharacterized protein (TIGR03089 family)